MVMTNFKKPLSSKQRAVLKKKAERKQNKAFYEKFIQPIRQGKENDVTDEDAAKNKKDN